jgi:predicted dehydrogenase
MAVDPERKIRWGVLGWARIARRTMVPAILRASHSEFYALASRKWAKRLACRLQYPGVRIYDSYDELLHDPAVDAVYIPLPNSQHCEWTIKAAACGKHVLCEKPIALNAAEGRAMTAACAQHEVKLMEAFMYRYTDRTRQVVEVLRSGVLGEIKFVEASFRSLLTKPSSIKMQPELGGGALYDLGCYPVNFAGLVADSLGGGTASARPESVAVACVRPPGGVDEIMSAVLRYPSGLIASLHCGFNAHKRVGAEIIGTRGVLEIPETFFNNAGTLTLTLDKERREIPVAASDPYRAEVEDFADAIRCDRPPLLGWDETLRNMEVIDRLYAAI